MSDDFKRQAADAAAAHVRDGMRLGLGTGSTAAHFVHATADRVAANGWQITCVATSDATADLARQRGLLVRDLDDVGPLDLAVDGADEIGPQLSLIKGGGAALLREKIVAAAAQRFIVIADASKVVAQLGAFALPVEIIPFAHATTQRRVAEICRAPVTLRQRDGAPVVTDNGNYVLDCACGVIADPHALATALKTVPGVVEHGLFLNMTHCAYVAGPDGVRCVDA